MDFPNLCIAIRILVKKMFTLIYKIGMFKKKWKYLQTPKLYQQNGAMKRSTTDSLAHPSPGKTFKHMTGHAN